MSPEAQRIAIAEACGYTHIDVIYKHQPPTFGDEPEAPREVLGIMGKFPTPTTCQPWVPDYLNDLNAMARAELSLSSHKYWEFVEWCSKLVKLRRVDFVADRASATAAQRAEAFLRTIGKWEDGR